MKLYLTIFVFLLFYLPQVVKAETYTLENIFVPPECKFTLTSPLNTSKTDRYGKPIVTDKTTLEASISKGDGVVFPFDYKDTDTIKTLLHLENIARENKIGCVWNITPPLFNKADSIGKTGRFMIVEGQVNNIYKSRSSIFLNFGENWKDDFTIQIDNKNKAFKNYDFEQLEGKNIRSRGFVDFYNGPSLKIDHPILLEIIEK